MNITKPITKICVYFVPSRSVLIRKKIWSTIKKCFYKSYQEVLQFNVLLKSVNQLPLTGQKKERIWMCFLVVRYYCPTLRYSIQLKKKRSRHIGLVFLIHCCNIYGNSEEFLTLLGSTLPKQKTSWARSTIQPMAILSVPLKSYMAKVAPKIKKEFLRTFNFWIITEPFIGKRY